VALETCIAGGLTGLQTTDYRPRQGDHGYGHGTTGLRTTGLILTLTPDSDPSLPLQASLPAPRPPPHCIAHVLHVAFRHVRESGKGDDYETNWADTGRSRNGTRTFRDSMGARQGHPMNRLPDAPILHSLMNRPRSIFNRSSFSRIA